jgi:hypothetical protein
LKSLVDDSGFLERLTDHVHVTGHTIEDEQTILRIDRHVKATGLAALRLVGP